MVVRQERGVVVRALLPKLILIIPHRELFSNLAKKKDYLVCIGAKMGLSMTYWSILSIKTYFLHFFLNKWP